MSNPHKSASLIHKVVRPVVEFLEHRQLLSATLSAGSSLMVFNAVENSSASQIETLTLTDTGDAALTLGVGSATVGTARFTVVNEASIPATLAPGASFGLQLQYNAVAVTTDTDTLSIVSNDPVNPTLSVALHGIGTAGLGGSNQPSLATVLQAYDIPTYVGEGFDDANAAEDSVYPYPPDASSQEQVIQRFVKAGAGLVTINVLASFTASGFDPYTLGTYTPGNPNSLSQLFTTPSTEAQSVYVQPKGVTSFDPGTSAFGFYCLSNVQVQGRVIYSEDALNTFDSTTGRHFRFFPMEQANGTIVPDEFIMTSTEWNAPIGYDFTNIVAIVSNVTAAPGAPNSPAISVENPNALPGSNTLVFNRIQSPDPTLGDSVHDTDVLQVTNTGGSPLTISSYTLSSQWSLVNPPTFPFAIAAGATLNLSIKFVAASEPSAPYNETNSPSYPGGGGVYNGNLVLNSNDPGNPVTTVPLAGWWQLHDQNSNEPSLQSLSNLLFGWSTDINPTPIPNLTQSLSIPSSPTYYGQETVTNYWAEADTGEDVEVQQIAAWHTQGDTSTTYWFPQGGSRSQLFETGSDEGQTLFPTKINSNSPAAAYFSSGGNFGFWLDKESTVDSQNTAVPNDGGHHTRFFPVYSSTGVLIPNTYIAAMDYSNEGGQNYDFNDNVYLIRNIRPATVTAGISSPQTTGAPAAPANVDAIATSSGVSLQWAPVEDSSLQSYNVYTSLAATSGFSLLATGITPTSYFDTTAPPGTQVFYRITAVDSNATESLGTQTGITTLGTAPVGLTSLDIGALPAGSTTLVSTGSYMVTAGGPGVSGAADGFRYLFELQTGDFDIKTQVQSLTAEGNFATAGIMARSTLDTDSANVYMSASPTNYRFKDRTTTAGTEGLVVGGTTAFPGTWVRLSRVGNVFNGYSSPDGVNWTLVSSVTVALPGRLYLGLAVAANDTAGTTTAQLVDFSNTSGGPTTVSFNANAISGEPTVLDVLSVDTDPGGTIDPTTVTITTPPNQGGQATVNASNGAITYTSTPGFVGTETFSYTVSDESAPSPATVVTVTVSPSGLVMNPSTFNVSSGQTFLANVLASDTDSTGTINPATLTIAGDTTDPNATVLVQDGEISYTPSSSFTGTDTITYTVQDSNGVNSVPTTATFIVTAPTGPIANSIATTTSSGQSVQINVLASDVSASGLNPATLTIITPVSDGTTQVNLSTGIVTYTPAAGFIGNDSFTYTVADDNGVVSSPGTVVIQVTPVGPVAANISAPALVSGGTVTVNVLGQATDGKGTLLPGAVTLVSNPADGTASVNTATGAIIYTPNAGFVGTDTLQYTVSDGTNISAPATLSLQVGVTINTTTARSLTYTDSSGSKVKVILTGTGSSAVIYFTGSGTLKTIAGPHGTGTLSANGSNLSISGMQVSGTSMVSTLTVSRVGTHSVALSNISVSGPLGRLIAPTSTLSGTFSVAGSMTLLELGSIANATMTIGFTGAARAGLTLTAGTVTNTSLTSATKISTLKVTSWLESGTADSISAPSITSLITSGNFQASLTATGGTPFALQSVRIGGQASADAWNVTGNTSQIVVGSMAAGWIGSFSGSIAGLTIRTGGFAGTLTAGAIGNLSFTGNDTGTITAASIRSARIVGQLNGAAVTTASGVAPRSTSLGRLTATGSMTNSKIISTGNIGTISAGGMTNSSIDAGIVNGITLPTLATDVTAAASIASVTITGRSSTFANSSIGAATLGTLSLGEILTANATAFGIARERLGMVDGAVCLRNHLDLLGLDEVLLDFYHLSEHVGAAAAKTLGAESEPARQWLAMVLHTLRHEGYAPFFQQLLDWRSPLRGGKRRAADELINYVASRQEMIVYEKCDSHGWDVGSGPMESMCGVTTDRIKGRGRRWDLENAEAMMALEALYQSTGLWDRYWQNQLAHRN